MKKLLTILTTSSAVFLITAGVMLANKNSNKNLILFNKDKESKEHRIVNGVLKEIGYYKAGKDIRIKFIPHNVHTIDATLPDKITSLKNAFVGNKQQIKWNKIWDTKNITNMSGVFYNQIWINDPSIKTWNTSQVTDMSDMFNGASTFNQDLSKWNVSKVTNMNGMFKGAIKYNNENNHLKWENKLDSIKTMKKMFKNTPAFKYSLKSWKIPNVVNNEDFGLDLSKQPQWKTEASPSDVPLRSLPEVDNSSNMQTPIISVNPTNPKKTPEKPKINNETIERNDNIKEKDNNPKNNTYKIPSSQTKKDNNPKNNTYKIPSSQTKKDNNPKNNTYKIPSSQTKKDNNPKNNTYKIPSSQTKTNTKSNSPNAGIIAGAVLGSFTILGTTAGLGYYYRKNLKNLYLKSTDKLKPSLLKSKDNIKDFYVKSIDKTKNLYFKSKNKIKDKIAKIKSKK
ncbi:BspA family leucine-rich repeat surface protein [Mycoplasma leachii]|uniref:BspA family leucine-rich repeat surface protein n=1 Tax=Mycoplasma leachii TaxID=2105 RepID=UPI003DA22B11